jgi:hypothetical protein
MPGGKPPGMSYIRLMRAVWVVAEVLAWSEWLNRRWSRTLVTTGGDGGSDSYGR